MRESERQVAREAVSRLLVARQSRPEVVAWMNAEGHRGTMGGEWTTGSLGRFLANPAIAGLERDPETGELRETGRPALITRNEFEELEALSGRTDGVAPVRQEDFPYLFSEGLTECGNCDHTMTGHRSNAGTPSYRCENCGIRITAAALEDYVGENALAELSRPGTREALEVAQEKMRVEAAALRRRIKSLTASRDGLAEPYAEGQVTRAVLVTADEKISEKLKEARTRLRYTEQIADAKLPIGDVEDLVRWWEHAPHASKRAVVALLFDRVRVMPARARGVRSAEDRVELKWRTSEAA
ncbi:MULTISPECIES: recombinase family protein [unclassified Streptomyces]|uniref:recombinase family protein n=1 Tax=unclassified Streptomyces TaxID=2593676 RepID=UPI00131A6C5F|nr:MULTISPECIES: recombinase family protein [unclassified Streptomyces]